MKKKALLKKGEKNTVPLNVTLYIGNKKKLNDNTLNSTCNKYLHSCY